MTQFNRLEVWFITGRRTLSDVSRPFSWALLMAPAGGVLVALPQRPLLGGLQGWRLREESPAASRPVWREGGVKNGPIPRGDADGLWVQYKRGFSSRRQAAG